MSSKNRRIKKVQRPGIGGKRDRVGHHNETCKEITVTGRCNAIINNGAERMNFPSVQSEEVVGDRSTARPDRNHNDDSA